MSSDVTRLYKIRYQVEDKASKPIVSIGNAATKSAADVGTLTTRTQKLSDALAFLWQKADDAADGLARLNVEMAKGKDAAGRYQSIGQALGRVDYNAGTASVSVEKLDSQLQKVGARASQVGSVQGSMQQLQRTTYGALKNAETLDLNIGKVVNRASGLNTVSVAAKGVGSGLKSATVQGDKLGGQIDGFAAKAGGLLVVTEAARSLADAFREGREELAKQGEEAIKLRDALREDANLSGKPGADNSIVKEHLDLRMQTGMTADEARKFSEQYKGSLPLAIDAAKNNPNLGIDEKTAEETKGEVGRLATRVGLSGDTAGDLAGSMGMYGKIQDKEVGLGRAQQVVDLLNDGRGNLTPLTRALLKGAASTVGEGKAFGSLSERAAAISVASGIGDKGATDTTVGAAIRGLSGGGTKEHKETLDRLGIGGKQSFMERLDRLKPLFDQAEKAGKSKNDALLEAGFGNITDRRALVGFYEQRETLRARIAKVKEDPNAPDAKVRAAGRRSAGLNDQFYATDKAARNRIATAQLDNANNEIGQKQENLQIARKEAEAELKKEGWIDSPVQRFGRKALSLFGLNPIASEADIRQEQVDNRVKSKAGYRFKGTVSAERAADELAETRAKQAKARADAGVKPKPNPAGDVRVKAAPMAIKKPGGPAGPPMAPVPPPPNGGQGVGKVTAPNSKTTSGVGPTSILERIAALLEKANQQRQAGQKQPNMGMPRVEYERR